MITASSAAVWDPGEHIMLKFSPRTGIVQIQMFESKPGSEWTYKSVRDIFIATCRTLDVLFAKCDADAPHPTNKRVRPTVYSLDRRVLPHREFLGWMGFVKKELSRPRYRRLTKSFPYAEKTGP